MGIFRPAVTESTGNKFTGICKFAVISFEDKSGMFDWADLYLDVVLNIVNLKWKRLKRVNFFLKIMMIYKLKNHKNSYIFSS